MDGQGNLERTWKVREKSGNLKINGNGRQTLENLFSLFIRGKDVLLCGSLRPSPSSLGIKFLPLRVTPKFEEIQLAPLN